MKTIEEIRKENGFNQEKFAELLGVSYRTYQGRIYKEQPRWTFDEILIASELNDGEVEVETEKGKFAVTIKKL